MKAVRGVWMTAVSAVLLAACGSAGVLSETPFAGPTIPSSATPVPSPGASTPTRSATPATPTPALAVGDLPARCAGATATSSSGALVAVQRGDVIDLVNLSGEVVNQTDADITSGLVVAVPNPGGLYLYHPATGDLTRLGSSGSPVDLGNVMAAPADAVFSSSFAVSPNGECWLLAAPGWGDGAGAAATTAVYGGVIGGAPLLITTLVRSAEPSVAYSVLRWDAAGVLLGSDPANSGGAGPFVDDVPLGQVVRFDPTSGSVSSPLCSGQFGDAAPDGTVACVTAGQITVERPGGTAITVVTGSALVGQVAFAGGSTTLTYCTAGSWSGVGDWADMLSVVDVGTSPAVPLQTADYQDFENALAFYKVLDGNSIVELEGATVVGASPTSLTVISLLSGQATTIGPAGLIIGAL